MIKRKNINMLSGSLYKSMNIYVIPVILSSLLSLAFHAADLVVVGRLCGSHAIAAVGSTTRIINLVTFLFLGFASGFGIVLSHALGEGNEEKIRRTVHTGIPFSIIVGAVVTAVGIFSSEFLLDITNVPRSLVHDAGLYLKIYFGGVILRMLQAFIGPIFRVNGDSRTPLIYLTIGGVLNVICNIFFVKVLGMTVDGVAWGTVVSEGVSSIIGLVLLMRRNDRIKFSFKHICLDFNVIKKTLQIGIPNGLQASMFSISTMFVSSAENLFGADTVAGNSAVLNITGFLDAVVSAYNEATAAFTGQNYGAQQRKRIKEVTRTALVSSGVLLITVGILVNIFSKQLLSIYITDNAEAIRIGRAKMLIVDLPYFLAAARAVMTASLRGIGDSRRPLYVSIVTICLFKVVWVYTVFKIPYFHTFLWLQVTYPLSWLLDSLVNGTVLLKSWRKLERAARKKQEALEHRRLMQKKKYRRKLRAAKR